MTNKPGCARRRGERGYNLIELMVAIVIIAISVLAVYEMFYQGTIMLTEEDNRQEVLDKLSYHMERLAAYVPVVDTVPRTLSGKFRESLYPEQEDVEPIEVIYTIKVTHSVEVREGGVPQYSDVAVAGDWLERSGRPVHIELRAEF